MAVKKVVASLDAAAKAPAEVKAEAPKTEVKKAEVKKTAAKKAEAPKAAAKKAEAPKAEAKKPVAKKAAAKKAEAPKAAAKKSAAAVEVKLQFADKEYTQEALVKIANDVWVYDYDKKASELKKIQLFVKPEESKVYYVFNDDITGDFNI